MSHHDVLGCDPYNQTGSLFVTHWAESTQLRKHFVVKECFFLIFENLLTLNNSITIMYEAVFSFTINVVLVLT